jgi:AbiU2
MNIRKLSGDERITRAKERAHKLVGHIATLFLMHEANALVIYSPKLAKQIPRSYAAHAFNQFQRSMHLFEIVRLCALWDFPGTDRESIPTIIELFNEPELVEQIARDTHDRYAKEVEPVDPDASSDAQDVAAQKAWWKKDRSAFAQKAEQEVRRQLAFAADKAAEVRASLRLKTMRKFRDAYIAHNLTFPEPDMKTEENVAPVRYGDETALLDDTVAVADALHCGLNGTSFFWEESKQIARKNAAALWDNCAFDIPSRSS